MTRLSCSAQHWEPGFGPCLGGDCVHNIETRRRAVEALAADLAKVCNVDVDKAVDAIRSLLASYSVVT